MRIKIYLHGYKEEMYDLGYDNGLRGRALSTFSCDALCEIEFTLEVDEDNGEYEIIEVDGRKLECKK